MNQGHDDQRLDSELLGGVLDSSFDGVIAFRSMRDGNGRIVDFTFLVVNKSAERIVGRGADELVGKRLLEEMPGAGIEGLFDLAVQVVESGKPSEIEHYYDHDHVQGWFRTRIVKFHDGLVVTFSDITERRVSDDCLQTSEARYRRLVETSRHGIVELDLNGVITYSNAAHHRILGYDDGALIGTSIFERIADPNRVTRIPISLNIGERTAGLSTYKSTGPTCATSTMKSSASCRY
jgi:PAS domain-containing protein